ncbi:peptidase S41 family protein-like protein [Decorospora gaudefroyi]|uniref:Peptidase S41 family protein-like protein n=1 Tax=Decorospora gaudefroyi TaxID=184978 RepID=A0A6A5JZS7_9PLEO|nr:peptidase S41 family protein-like protein [Decorospora gaudefroyi]
MKTLVTLSALIAIAKTQTISINPTESLNIVPTEAPTSTSIDDFEIEPSSTRTVSGPIESSRACRQISQYVLQTYEEYPFIEAELAYACLKSLPFYPDDASTTIDEIKKMVEFQSTLAYLKDPPEGYPNEAVDIMAGLDKIKSDVNDGQYTNEFDFETDIAALMIKAHDGHLAWNGMAYAGAFRWRRSPAITLVSASQDGTGLPKVWALQDFNNTNAAYEPSPVTHIDGQDVTQFLTKEADLTAYHDPDTRYNAMFFMQAAENYGLFIVPRFYPGPTTNITYANETTDVHINAAMVVQPETWMYIDDSETFYETYIDRDISEFRVKKRSPDALPLHLENPRDHELRGAFSLTHGSVPVFYPEPIVTVSTTEVYVAGYFLNDDTGVLVIQTFNTPSVSAAQEFQSVIQEYISLSQANNVNKHIIDIRSNGGGKVLSGYDAYLQFFPSQEPQVQSRYRGHAATELFGAAISSYEEINVLNADLFMSPFSNDAFLSSTLEPLESWSDMYPPEVFKDDNFTTLLRYNLSDPLVTSNELLAIGITMTGYGDRSNFTTDPFPAENLILLSDGICASTCAIFTELMTRQSGVRTLALGGRPQDGPMDPVGGTKGTLVMLADYIEALSFYIPKEFASFTREARNANEFLLEPPPIAVYDASVNFQDNIRVGAEKEGVPSQFLSEQSSCRMWYQSSDFFDVTNLWQRVADTAFGDEGKCVRVVGPQGGGGGGNGGDEPEDSAVGVRVGWATMLVCFAAVVFSGLVM